MGWYTVICSSIFSRGLDQTTLQGETVFSKSTSCVYIQSQLRQASLTTEVGIEARCIPHIPVVLQPSGKLRDQIGKSVPGVGAKFGVIRGRFIQLWLESTRHVLLWPSSALGFLTHLKYTGEEIQCREDNNNLFSIINISSRTFSCII